MKHFRLRVVPHELTIIVCVAVLVHPAALVPVTVYVVVITGETVTDVPLSAPGCQVYVEALLPVSVVDEPEQMEVEVAEIVTFGKALTVIVLVDVFVQPLAPVPVTV